MELLIFLTLYSKNYWTRDLKVNPLAFFYGNS